MAPIGKYILVPIFVGAALFGFKATVGTMFADGLGDAVVAVREAKGALTLPGAPEPYRAVYTHFEPMDQLINTLVPFFSALVDGDVGWNQRATYVWFMGQFCAGWTALVLESLRAGNRGRLVSYIAVAGLMVQTASWTLTVPLWLCLHLLTSPAASLRNGDGPAIRRALFVYLWDLALLPMSVALGYIVPAVMMSMPGLLGHTAASHYFWIAIWQAFPLWTMVVLRFLHGACYFVLGSLPVHDAEARPTTLGNAYLVAVRGVYEFALTVCAVTHLPILAVSLLPAPAREILAHMLPAGLKGAARAVTFAETFVPHPPFAGPPSHLSAAGADLASLPSGALAPLAVHFLHYDMWAAAGPLLLWAAYMHQTTVARPRLGSLLATALGWGLVAGPMGALLAILWERDEAVREGETEEDIVRLGEEEMKAQ